ncbi:hypothetical protein Nepgr_021435 [Nepenthes gracilis]|uniref:Uncharacterized protein n=1 Tax=Nepenthes gracilis TaxID=150966 RepID=A0AAD3SZF8_NEPGR|nr:hypothetical protein Nepgr_021435 [Nepenthes gracilis]
MDVLLPSGLMTWMSASSQLWSLLYGLDADVDVIAGSCRIDIPHSESLSLCIPERTRADVAVEAHLEVWICLAGPQDVDGLLSLAMTICSAPGCGLA